MSWSRSLVSEWPAPSRQHASDRGDIAIERGRARGNLQESAAPSCRGSRQSPLLLRRTTSTLAGQQDLAEAGSFRKSGSRENTENDMNDFESGRCPRVPRHSQPTPARRPSQPGRWSARLGLLASAVLTTLMMAGSASAGYWSIVGAVAGGSAPGGGAFSMDSPVNNYFASNFGPGGNPQGAANLSQTDATNILSNLGVVLASNTLTYFGFVDAAGRGYMAVAFKNTTASAFEAFLSGNGLASGSQGLYSTDSLILVSPGASAGSFNIGTNSTFLMVMGGFSSGSASISLNFNPNSGSIDVRYLSYNSGTSSYAAVASGVATTLQGSGGLMAFQAAAVPVPAPMLLASAGLVVGLLLRRRLAA